MNKENRRTLMCDITIVFAALIWIIYLAGLFFDNLNMSQTECGEPSGSAAEVDGNVRRRLERRLVWDAIGEKSPVYNGDIVRTGALSQVTLEFNNGDNLKLNENSMVLVFVSGSGGRFELLSGSLIAQSAYSENARNSVVVAGGREFKISNGMSLDVREEASGEFVAVQKNNPSDNGGAADNDKAAQAPTPLSPVPGETFVFYGPDPYLRFRWLEPLLAYGEQHSAYYIEVADNPNFLNPVLAKTVRGSSILCGNLDAGDWYWRIIPDQPRWQCTVPETHFTILYGDDGEAVTGAVLLENPLVFENVKSPVLTPAATLSAAPALLKTPAKTPQATPAIDKIDNIDGDPQHENPSSPAIPTPNAVIELEW